MRRLVAILLVACSSKTEPAPVQASPCATGFVLEGKTCAPKFDTCPEGELPTFGGGCLAIGTTAIAAPTCEAGQIAVPGDAACHPISACGAEPWGELPDEPSAKWVDGKALEGGDGTRAKPFRTLAEALTVAPSGSLIGIAAGTYTVNVDLRRPVRIHGRCASMVELQGDPALVTDHVIQASADLDLKGVSISSPYIGLGVYRANATVDSVHFHDTEYSAIEALGYDAPPKVTVRNTVIDRARHSGMTLFGADVVVERSVIRNARPRADGKAGDSIVIRPRREGALLHPARLEVRSSVIEKSRRAGISAFGATLLVEGSIIRGTRANAADSGGMGIIADDYEGSLPELTLKSSLIEDNQFSQVSVQAGRATLERVVARKGVPTSAGLVGGGIIFEVGTTFSLSDSLVEQTRAFGIAASGAEGIIRNVVVRDVIRETKGAGGVGIQVGDDEETFAKSRVTITRTRLDRCEQLGLLIIGSDVDAEELAIFDIKPTSNQTFGDGIGITTHRAVGLSEPVVATLKLRKSIIERMNRAALTLFGADASIESSRFRCAPIALNAERAYGPPDTGDKFERAFALEDLGGNVCGCGEPAVCKVDSTGLAPLK